MKRTAKVFSLFSALTLLLAAAPNAQAAVQNWTQ